MRELLRKGMIFLRNGRYHEAIEWWTLHRQRLGAKNSVDLLLLIMEMLTWTLMKDHAHAADLRGRFGFIPAMTRRQNMTIRGLAIPVRMTAEVSGK